MQVLTTCMQTVSAIRLISNEIVRRQRVLTARVSASTSATSGLWCVINQ